MTDILNKNHEQTQAELSLTLKLLNSEKHYLWDLLVKTVPTGCFMQSWAWADFKELAGLKQTK
jgi:hypothetical protein